MPRHEPLRVAHNPPLGVCTVSTTDSSKAVREVSRTESQTFRSLQAENGCRTSKAVFPLRGFQVGSAPKEKQLSGFPLVQVGKGFTIPSVPRIGSLSSLSPSLTLMLRLENNLENKITITSQYSECERCKKLLYNNKCRENFSGAESSVGCKDLCAHDGWRSDALSNLKGHKIPVSSIG